MSEGNETPAHDDALAKVHNLANAVRAYGIKVNDMHLVEMVDSAMGTIEGGVTDIGGYHVDPEDDEDDDLDEDDTPAPAPAPVAKRRPLGAPPPPPPPPAKRRAKKK